jgi:hypothetical protein
MDCPRDIPFWDVRSVPWRLVHEELNYAVERTTSSGFPGKEAKF